MKYEENTIIRDEEESGQCHVRVRVACRLAGKGREKNGEEGVSRNSKAARLRS
jgi:hypothetical protein